MLYPASPQRPANLPFHAAERYRRQGSKIAPDTRDSRKRPIDYFLFHEYADCFDACATKFLMRRRLYGNARAMLAARALPPRHADYSAAILSSLPHYAPRQIRGWLPMRRFR